VAAEEIDQGVKRLAQSRPRDLVAFAVPGAEYLGPLATDLATASQLVADTLFRVRYKGVECVVNLEVEAAPGKEMADRVFLYGSRAYALYRRPVLSVVLWLQKEHGGRPPASPWQMGIPGEGLATWKFRRIELYNTPAEELLQRGLEGFVGLLPLVPFTRGGKRKETARRQRE
jgi:hypothetical protein